ncbi:MAG: energy transducer TonB [Thermoanaerobaculia bacterium]
MDRPFHYLEQENEPEGTALGVGVSLTLHVAILLVIFLNLGQKKEEKEEPLRFVQLVPPVTAPAQPRVFVEAPGAAVEEPPRADAALSDANRRAAGPGAQGEQPTRRPGDGSGDLHIPAPPPAAAAAAEPQIIVPPTPRPAEQEHKGNGHEAPSRADELQYRVEKPQETEAVEASVNWRAAIRNMGRVPSTGGAGGRLGGEAGFAESGPISFETKWYDWGPYAAHMVARIRLHWYENMPEVIRLGLEGVVVIRFTIERSGQITDVTILQSSGVPPFDFAARKAIELSSPLNPLPADFPEPSERVTAAFYYNMEPPAGR